MAEKKAGRPSLTNDSEKKEKKVMLSFTKSEYEDLKKIQVLLNQPTLTAMLQNFISRGRKDMVNELIKQI